MNKYIYIAILILVFTVSSAIVYYKNEAKNYKRDYDELSKDYIDAMSKLDQQEKSMNEYKEAIKKQTDELSKLNDSRIVYENDLNTLKQELSNLNLEQEIKQNPAIIKVVITKKINDKFKEIEEVTKWNIL